MGFFDDIALRRHASPEPPLPRPPWQGPPENELPALVAVEAILAHTEDTVLSVTNIHASRSGIAFTLDLRLRTLNLLDQFGPEIHRQIIRPRLRIAEDQLPPDVLRFGVQLADGRKATNLDDSPWSSTDKVPEGPVLVQHGGGGGGHQYSLDYWLWPLPPRGSLTFVCEWSARGISETRHPIDGRLIRDAADQATVLWPNAPER